MSIDVYTITFCFIVYCDCYILFIVACCPIKATGGQGVFVSFRQTACIYNSDFSWSFNNYPPLASSIGYPPPNRSRLYKGGYIHCFYSHIIICQFAALFPLVTSQAWLRSDIP